MDSNEPRQLRLHARSPEESSPVSDSIGGEFPVQILSMVEKKWLNNWFERISTLPEKSKTWSWQMRAFFRSCLFELFFCVLLAISFL